MKRLLVLVLCASLGACTQVVVAPGDASALLDGKVLFGESVPAAPDVDMLELDAEMRAYVSSKVTGVRHSRVKLEQLITGMIDDGLLTLEYDPNLTHSAARTFHQRQGNCLSFSVLFAALAREAGLNAQFQLVEIPPSFSQQGEFIQLNNHINVLVRGVRSGTLYTRDHVVDFNTAEYNGNYETKRVDDARVSALFHSNLAVEAMRAGNDRLAFAHLKLAIGRAPDIADLWVNLGALYSRHGHNRQAIDAFNKALSITPSNKSALVNLAQVHDRIGDSASAAFYRARTEYHLKRNPYYHYHLAKTAYGAEEYGASLESLETAIRLKPDEHQFHLLRGLDYLALGDADRGLTSIRTARQLATHPVVVQKYDAKLSQLAGKKPEED